MDLKYKNKEGITLQQVLDTIKANDGLSKKDLTTAVKAKKSIDTLINKLINDNLILKVKDGRAVKYTSVDKAVIIPPENTLKKLTAEVNQEDLDYLKQEMENIEGKPVTAILHKRNEKKPKKEHVLIDEIYEANKSEEYILDKENPFRFVLNFFTSTLNGELSTPHFKRRDNYVVKSIYNKFKTVCDKMDKYDTEQQHIPFYRAFTIDKDTLTVKMYHIDMNRVIRGYHNLFQLSDDDKKFIFGDK